MASSHHVEVEAAKVLHKLIQDSKDEPAKLATKLYVILQHMKLSGKEQSLPYQVISRAMETVISQHGLDIDALRSAHLPLAGGPQTGDSGLGRLKDKDVPDNSAPISGIGMPQKGDSSSASHAASSIKAREDDHGSSVENETLKCQASVSNRPPIGTCGVESAGLDVHQGSVSQRSSKSFEHESPASIGMEESRSATSRGRHSTAKFDKQENKKAGTKRKKADSAAAVVADTDNVQKLDAPCAGFDSKKGKMLTRGDIQAQLATKGGSLPRQSSRGFWNQSKLGLQSENSQGSKLSSNVVTISEIPIPQLTGTSPGIINESVNPGKELKNNSNIYMAGSVGKVNEGSTGAFSLYPESQWTSSSTGAESSASIPVGKILDQGGVSHTATNTPKIAQASGTLGPMGKEHALGKHEMVDHRDQDAFTMRNSEGLQKDTCTDSSGNFETSERKKANPIDIGRTPGPQALTSSSLPFKEHQLKQLRAQCLVFLAFRNRMPPRKLHLEIALGESNPKEGGSTDGSHKGDFSLKEPVLSHEIAGPFGKLNDNKGTEREMLLTRTQPVTSSAGTLKEMGGLSKDTEGTKFTKNKRGPPYDQSLTIEESKWLSAARAKQEADMKIQETADSQRVMTKPLESGSAMNGEKIDLAHGHRQVGHTNQAFSSVPGASKQLDPLVTSMMGINTPKEMQTPISVECGHLQERLENPFNQFHALKGNDKISIFHKADVPIFQTNAPLDKYTSALSVKDQAMPSAGKVIEHDYFMHMVKPPRDVNMYARAMGPMEKLPTGSVPVFSNSVVGEQRLSDIQKQFTSGGFKALGFSNAVTHGNSVSSFEKPMEAREAVIPVSSNVLGSSPNYTTTEKWIVDHQKRKLLEEQKWSLKQRKTEARIKARFNKLKENVSTCEDISVRTRSVIELKKLQLLQLQRHLRREFLHGFFKPVATDMERLKSIKKHRHGRRMKQLERLEQKMKEERQKRIRERQKEFFSEIEAHKEKLEDCFKVKRERWKYYNRCVKEFHKKKEKMHRERADRIQREKINLLKINDVEGYLRMVQDTKSDRVKQLLKETEKYLQKLGSKVLEAKAMARQFEMEMDDNRSVTVLEKNEIAVDNDDDGDQAQHYLESNEKYYLMAHSVKESISEQPASLEGGKLREYQMNGLRWLVSLYNNRLNGILADEMGLGKTVQVISLVCYLMESKNDRGPFLVVVPSSVLPGWESELSFWAPSVSTVIYAGPPEERRRLYKEQVVHQKFNILLTTYEYLMNKNDRPRLSKIHWRYIIIDEGHRIKNASCKLNSDLKHYQSSHRLLLTGTPLQNNIEELWALLNFLLPNIFNSSEDFSQWFSRPFENSGDNSPDEALLSEEENLLIINRLHQVLRPFVLRRLKQKVENELPEKIERLIRCEASAYQKLLMKRVEENLGSIGTSRGRSVHNSVMELRNICNHPYLSQLHAEEVDSLIPKHYLPPIVRLCGKLEMLDRLLPKLKATGHRVLFFSTMTRLLDIMEEYLSWKRYRYLRLDGHTSGNERGALIEEFNKPDSPAFIFLLSIRAGGVGVNLQAADTVIIFDTDWNPQVDLQAQARAHRIGQKRDVLVLRLETVNTVEEQVRAAAEYKLGVANQSITAGFFDNNTSAEDRREYLESLLRECKKEEAALVLDDDALNYIIARSESEIDIFESVDKQRREGEMAAWQSLQQERSKEGPLLLPPRLMTDEDLSEFYKAMETYEAAKAAVKRKSDVGELDTQQYGRGKRAREVRSYEDKWTEEEFEKLCQVDSPEPPEPKEVAADPSALNDAGGSKLEKTDASLSSLKEPLASKEPLLPSIEAQFSSKEPPLPSSSLLAPESKETLVPQSKKLPTTETESLSQLPAPSKEPLSVVSKELLPPPSKEQLIPPCKGSQLTSKEPPPTYNEAPPQPRRGRGRPRRETTDSSAPARILTMPSANVKQLEMGPHRETLPGSVTNVSHHIEGQSGNTQHELDVRTAPGSLSSLGPLIRAQNKRQGQRPQSGSAKPRGRARKQTHDSAAIASEVTQIPMLPKDTRIETDASPGLQKAADMFSLSHEKHTSLPSVPDKREAETVSVSEVKVAATVEIKATLSTGHMSLVESKKHESVNISPMQARQDQSITQSPNGAQEKDGELSVLDKKDREMGDSVSDVKGTAVFGTKSTPGAAHFVKTAMVLVGLEQSVGSQSATAFQGKQKSTLPVTDKRNVERVNSISEVKTAAFDTKSARSMDHISSIELKKHVNAKLGVMQSGREQQTGRQSATVDQEKQKSIFDAPGNREVGLVGLVTEAKAVGFETELKLSGYDAPLVESKKQKSPKSSATQVRPDEKISSSSPTVVSTVAHDFMHRQKPQLLSSDMTFEEKRKLTEKPESIQKAVASDACKAVQLSRCGDNRPCVEIPVEIPACRDSACPNSELNMSSQAMKSVASSVAAPIPQKQPPVETNKRKVHARGKQGYTGKASVSNVGQAAFEAKEACIAESAPHTGLVPLVGKASVSNVATSVAAPIPEASPIADPIPQKQAAVETNKRKVPARGKQGRTGKASVSNEVQAAFKAKEACIAESAPHTGLVPLAGPKEHDSSNSIIITGGAQGNDAKHPITGNLEQRSLEFQHPVTEPLLKPSPITKSEFPVRTGQKSDESAMGKKSSCLIIQNLSQKEANKVKSVKRTTLGTQVNVMKAHDMQSSEATKNKDYGVAISLPETSASLSSTGQPQFDSRNNDISQPKAPCLELQTSEAKSEALGSESFQGRKAGGVNVARGKRKTFSEGVRQSPRRHSKSETQESSAQSSNAYPPIEKRVTRSARRNAGATLSKGNKSQIPENQSSASKAPDTNPNKTSSVRSAGLVNPMVTVSVHLTTALTLGVEVDKEVHVSEAKPSSICSATTQLSLEKLPTEGHEVATNSASSVTPEPDTVRKKRLSSDGLKAPTENDFCTGASESSTDPRKHTCKKLLDDSCMEAVSVVNSASQKLVASCNKSCSFDGIKSMAGNDTCPVHSKENSPDAMQPTQQLLAEASVGLNYSVPSVVREVDASCEELVLPDGAKASVADVSCTFVTENRADLRQLSEEKLLHAECNMERNQSPSNGAPRERDASCSSGNQDSSDEVKMNAGNDSLTGATEKRINPREAGQVKSFTEGLMEVIPNAAQKEVVSHERPVSSKGVKEATDCSCTAATGNSTDLSQHSQEKPPSEACGEATYSVPSATHEGDTLCKDTEASDGMKLVAENDVPIAVPLVQDIGTPLTTEAGAGGKPKCVSEECLTKSATVNTIDGHTSPNDATRQNGNQPETVVTDPAVVETPCPVDHIMEDLPVMEVACADSTKVQNTIPAEEHSALEIKSAEPGFKKDMDNPSNRHNEQTVAPAEAGSISLNRLESVAAQSDENGAEQNQGILVPDAFEFELDGQSNTNKMTTSGLPQTCRVSEYTGKADDSLSEVLGTCNIPLILAASHEAICPDDHITSAAATDCGAYVNPMKENESTGDPNIPGIAFKQAGELACLTCSEDPNLSSVTLESACFQEIKKVQTLEISDHVNVQHEGINIERKDNSTDLSGNTRQDGKADDSTDLSGKDMTELASGLNIEQVNKTDNKSDLPIVALTAHEPNQDSQRDSKVVACVDVPSVAPIVLSSETSARLDDDLPVAKCNSGEVQDACVSEAVLPSVADESCNEGSLLEDCRNHHVPCISGSTDVGTGSCSEVVNHMEIESLAEKIIVDSEDQALLSTEQDDSKGVSCVGDDVKEETAGNADSSLSLVSEAFPSPAVTGSCKQESIMEVCQQNLVPGDIGSNNNSTESFIHEIPLLQAKALADKGSDISVDQAVIVASLSSKIEGEPTDVSQVGADENIEPTGGADSSLASSGEKSEKVDGSSQKEYMVIINLDSLKNITGDGELEKETSRGNTVLVSSPLSIEEDEKVNDSSSEKSIMIMKYDHPVDVLLVDDEGKETTTGNMGTFLREKNENVDGMSCKGSMPLSTSDEPMVMELVRPQGKEAPTENAGLSSFPALKEEEEMVNAESQKFPAITGDDAGDPIDIPPVNFAENESATGNMESSLYSTLHKEDEKVNCIYVEDSTVSKYSHERMDIPGVGGKEASTGIEESSSSPAWREAVNCTSNKNAELSMSSNEPSENARVGIEEKESSTVIVDLSTSPCLMEEDGTVGEASEKDSRMSTHSDGPVDIPQAGDQEKETSAEHEDLCSSPSGQQDLKVDGTLQKYPKVGCKENGASMGNTYSSFSPALIQDDKKVVLTSEKDDKMSKNADMPALGVKESSPGMVNVTSASALKGEDEMVDGTSLKDATVNINPDDPMGIPLVGDEDREKSVGCTDPSFSSKEGNCKVGSEGKEASPGNGDFCLSPCLKADENIDGTNKTATVSSFEDPMDRQWSEAQEKEASEGTATSSQKEGEKVHISIPENNSMMSTNSGDHKDLPHVVADKQEGSAGITDSLLSASLRVEDMAVNSISGKDPGLSTLSVYPMDIPLVGDVEKETLAGNEDNSSSHTRGKYSKIASTAHEDTKVGSAKREASTGKSDFSSSSSLSMDDENIDSTSKKIMMGVTQSDGPLETQHSGVGAKESAENADSSVSPNLRGDNERSDEPLGKDSSVIISSDVPMASPQMGTEGKEASRGNTTSSPSSSEGRNINSTSKKDLVAGAGTDAAVDICHFGSDMKEPSVRIADSSPSFLRAEDERFDGSCINDSIVTTNSDHPNPLQVPQTGTVGGEASMGKPDSSSFREEDEKADGLFSEDSVSKDPDGPLKAQCIDIEMEEPQGGNCDLFSSPSLTAEEKIDSPSGKVPTIINSDNPVATSQTLAGNSNSSLPPSEAEGEIMDGPSKMDFAISTGPDDSVDICCVGAEMKEISAGNAELFLSPRLEAENEKLDASCTKDSTTIMNSGDPVGISHVGTEETAASIGNADPLSYSSLIIKDERADGSSGEDSKVIPNIKADTTQLGSEEKDVSTGNAGLFLYPSQEVEDEKVGGPSLKDFGVTVISEKAMVRPLVGVEKTNESPPSVVEKEKAGEPSELIVHSGNPVEEVPVGDEVKESSAGNSGSSLHLPSREEDENVDDPSATDSMTIINSENPMDTPSVQVQVETEASAGNVDSSLSSHLEVEDEKVDALSGKDYVSIINSDNPIEIPEFRTEQNEASTKNADQSSSCTLLEDNGNVDCSAEKDYKVCTGFGSPIDISQTGDKEKELLEGNTDPPSTSTSREEDGKVDDLSRKESTLNSKLEDPQVEEKQSSTENSATSSSPPTEKDDKVNALYVMDCTANSCSDDPMAISQVESEDKSALAGNVDSSSPSPREEDAKVDGTSEESAVNADTADLITISQADALGCKALTGNEDPSSSAREEVGGTPRKGPVVINSNNLMDTSGPSVGRKESSTNHATLSPSPSRSEDVKDAKGGH